MGSSSLMIILILVVWIVVLAPLVVGNNKPIRRSGEGYEETRVLHSGGTEPMATRRRPKLTAADVHKHGEDADYELVEAVSEEEQVLIDDAPALRVFGHREPEDAGHVEGEVIEHLDDEATAEVGEEPLAASEEEADEAVEAVEAAAEAPAGGSTAWSVLRAQAAAEEAQRYQIDESYEAPSDYGYEGAAEDSDEDTGEDADSGAVVTEHEPSEAEAADSADSADEDDLAFAASRRGRGGYDPERERSTTATRFQRRQRTLLALIAACVVTFVVAIVAGGWTWALPAVTVGLTVWFMVALRRVVLQERALRERRLRQLRRARLGVVTAGEDIEGRVRRRTGSTVVTLDDEHPDFDALPTTRFDDAPRTPDRSPGIRRREYDDFGDYGSRAS